MSFPLDDIVLGPRAYGQRKGTEAVVLHTTEGSGITRDAALGIIRMQSVGGSLYSGGGSYHFLIHETGVILTVPYLESAGSLTANHTPPPTGVWKPSDKALRMLSAAAQADTNAYVVAVCFQAKAADLALALQNGRSWARNMVDTAARVIRWIEQQPWAPDDIPVLDHADFQTNRTDPGAGVNAAVLTRYAELFATPTPAPNPAVTVYAGQPTAFGTRYPSYVLTAEQALAWVNRRIRELYAAGKLP